MGIPRRRRVNTIEVLKSPTVGAAYLEEFSLGNAEDVTLVLSTTYSLASGAISI